MKYIERLKNLYTIEDLIDLIQVDYQDCYDFFLAQKYSEIIKYKDEIEDILTEKFNLISQLDFSNESYKSFLSIILLACERLSLFGLFERYYNLFKKKEDILYKLQAVAKYRIGCRRFNDYESRVDDILELLKLAFENEEDNLKDVLAIFISYYVRVIYNFGHLQIKLNSFKEKIRNSINNNYILQEEIINNVLSIDTRNAQNAYDQIQNLLDEYLNRDFYIPIHFIDKELFLIEENSDYSHLLEDQHKSFEAIKNICTEEYQKIADDKIYHSLGRGTVILDDEKQLYAYFYSFGSVHYEKIKSAFEFLDFSSKPLLEPIQIIDWGCGQGLASVVFLELYSALNIQSVKLIEPSEIAIKRAALHIKHMNDNILIETICKPIELLDKKDIQTKKNSIKIHLFSNILDVEAFSIKNLFKLIDTTQKGVNYFVCASPYSTNIRNKRIEDFVYYFENNPNNEYKFLGHAISSKISKYWNCNNKHKGEMCFQHIENGCKRKWTRLINVFKVNI